jgi:hypothetical protein
VVSLGTPVGNATKPLNFFAVGTIVNDDKKPADKRKTPGLTAKVTPKRDKTAPFSFVVTGKLKKPKGVSSAKARTGKVRITVKRGTKTIRTRTGFVDATCNYTVPVSLAKSGKGRLRFVARFLGNRTLKAKSARSVTARAG